MTLDESHAKWQACSACALRATCTQVVYGETYSRGDVTASPLILIIGEAPGRAEDIAGEPFSGPAGKLLREQLEEADFRLGFITDSVGCRPPGSRDPLPREIEACAPRLQELVDILQPSGILFVGKVSEQANSGARWTRGIHTAAIVHPTALLNQGHPTPKTRKTSAAQVVKIKRLLLKAAKSAGVQAPAEVVPEEKPHEHNFGQVGVWQHKDPGKNLPILRCDCGVVR